MNVRISKVNLAENLREFDLNLISSCVCTFALNVVYSQKFDHEIWNKKKQRKI